MKNCKECNTTFWSTHPRKIYCSLKCGNRVAKRKECKKLRKPLQIIACNNCKKEFLQLDSRQKYCSKKCINRFFRVKHKMDGNWIKAMERDGHKCRLCSNVDNLVAHHIDGTGEDYSPNHTLDNLVVLCRACHFKCHQMNFKVVDGMIVIDSPITKLVGVLPVVFMEQLVSPTGVMQ